MWKTFYRKNSEMVSYEIDSILLSKQTRYQLVDIVKTKTFGISLFLDNSPQSSEIDEFIYHESLVHPALVGQVSPHNVLICGGAEGAVAREVFRYNTINKVSLVDIDSELLEICARCLPKWHQNSFSNPRLNLRNCDARAFLEETDERYDCILIDVTAPKKNSPSFYLFTREFYKTANDKLLDDGILVTQAQSAALNNLEPLVSIRKTLLSIFKFVHVYTVYIPFYSDLWGFVLASNKHDPSWLSTEEVNKKLHRFGCRDLYFYDGLTHNRMFSLPKNLRDKILQEGRILTDADPFSWNSYL
jgi:spermidine synthase